MLYDQDKSEKISISKKFTQYEQLSPQATLQYSNDSFQQSSIVSSIDFDCDADFFAVAGVTKKIKVYDYQRVIQNSVNQIHTPSIQMECSSKISCVAWNKYHKVVILFDINKISYLAYLE